MKLKSKEHLASYILTANYGMFRNLALVNLQTCQTKKTIVDIQDVLDDSTAGSKENPLKISGVSVAGSLRSLKAPCCAVLVPHLFDEVFLQTPCPCVDICKVLVQQDQR